MGVLDDDGNKSRYDDPVNCDGCLANVQQLYLAGDRHDGLRADVLWGKMEETNKVSWKGDIGQHHNPGLISSPFSRGEDLQGREQLTDLFESGFWRGTHLSIWKETTQSFLHSFLDAGVEMA